MPDLRGAFRIEGEQNDHEDRQVFEQALAL